MAGVSGAAAGGTGAVSSYGGTAFVFAFCVSGDVEPRVAQVGVPLAGRAWHGGSVGGGAVGATEIPTSGVHFVVMDAVGAGYNIIRRFRGVIGNVVPTGALIPYEF